MSEVVIVGGGPAGLNCAYHLAKEGKDVILIERNAFPVDKLCAGGLTVKDFHEGIPKDIVERTFARHIIHTPLGKTIFKTLKPSVFTVNRKTLSMWLFERAIKAGVKIEKGKVVKININAVITKDGRQYNYHYLVGADGSFSVVRRYLRIPIRHFLLAWQTSIPFSLKEIEWFLDASSFSSGYGWIFPYKKNAVVGFVCPDPKDTPKAKIRFLHWLKKTHGLIIDRPFKAHLINTDYRGCHFGRIYLAGDAAGFASGLTGEGIYFALASGRSIAQMILSGKNSLTPLNKPLVIKHRHEQTAQMLSFLPRFLLKGTFECFRKSLKMPFLGKLILKWYG